MRSLDKLEKKFGKFAIKNLMMGIVIINMAIYLIEYLIPSANLTFRFILIPELVLRGEIWRLVTFIFIPPPTTMIWLLFALYFYYMIGTSLEHQWGSFKFNAFYFTGMLLTILTAFISGGWVLPTYLNLSLFLAFAYVFPDFQILLFFILPIKVKYLAFVNIGYMVYSFSQGALSTKLSIAAVLVNFLLFFGRDIFLKTNIKSAHRQRKKLYVVYSAPKKEYFHRCTVCGITDKENPTMEFRYCSGCGGDYEYCMEHLKNHQHVEPVDKGDLLH